MNSKLDHQVNIMYANGSEHSVLVRRLRDDGVGLTDDRKMGVSGLKIASEMYIGAMVFPITVINLERYSYTFSILLCSDVSETYVSTKIKCKPGGKVFIRFLTFNASEVC